MQQSTNNNNNFNNNNSNSEKSKNSQTKHIPKDAQVIISILTELGIQDYEPRVINQLLEFTYRYVTCIMDDAKVYANHAKKKTIDLEDVKLACDMVLDKTFTTPPPRQVLTKLAELRNSMPLPPIKPHCGLRLPPDRYCLTAANYRLRSANQSKKMTKSAIESRSTIKTQITTSIVNNPSIIGSSIKRGPPPLAVTKSQVTTIPKPVFKFSNQPKQITVNPGGSKIAVGNVGSDTKMEVDGDIESEVINSANELKRKHEEDEFEVVS